MHHPNGASIEEGTKAYTGSVYYCLLGIMRMNMHMICMCNNTALVQLQSRLRSLYIALLT